MGGVQGRVAGVEVERLHNAFGVAGIHVGDHLVGIGLLVHRGVVQGAVLHTGSKIAVGCIHALVELRDFDVAPPVDHAERPLGVVEFAAGGFGIGGVGTQVALVEYSGLIVLAQRPFGLGLVIIGHGVVAAARRIGDVGIISVGQRVAFQHLGRYTGRIAGIEPRTIQFQQDLVVAERGVVIFALVGFLSGGFVLLQGLSREGDGAAEHQSGYE